MSISKNISYSNGDIEDKSSFTEGKNIFRCIIYI